MIKKQFVDENTTPHSHNISSTIIDNLMEGCQLIGHDGRYLYVNEAAARHAKKPCHELLGKTMAEVFPGIENTHMYTMLQRCLKLHESRIMDNEFTYEDGTRAFFELRFEPVPEGVFILSMDITNRKETEKHAWHLNFRLEKLTRVIQDLSNTSSPDGIISCIKNASNELFLCDKTVVYIEDKQFGNITKDIMHAMEQWACEQSLMKNEIMGVADVLMEKDFPESIKHDPYFRSMLVVPCKSSSLRGAIGLFRKNPSAITNEDIYMLQALCDSTQVALERVRIYSDLNSSHKQYRDLVENLNDVVFYVNNRKQFVYISPVINHFGYIADELIGREFSELVYPDDIHLVNHRFAGTLAGHDGAGEFRLIDKRGAVRYVRVSYRAVINDGTSIGVTGIIVDLTEKRKTEEQLKAAQRLEAIGTLAGGIAHDFNNILSSIIGFTQLSQDETDPESEVGTYLDEIYTAGNRAKELVRQILTFARQSDVDVKPIQISTIAKEVVKFIRSSTPANIFIRSDIQSRSLIIGNTTQIHQVFMNLLTNAIHALENQDEGEIDIEIKDVFIEKKTVEGSMELNPGPYLFIRVTDTGLGIDPDILPNIFEPYFTTKETGKGTGMGLSIIHGIIQSYGGHIQVNSTPGEGSSFTIYFKASNERVIQSCEKILDIPRGDERILFVDDEAALARMSARTLSRLGYHVTIQTSSLEALSVFQNNPNDFDLIITDMTMPSMTGDRLAKEILKIRGNIPVILCTGYSKNISEVKAKKIGIKALVHKPMLKADIANVIRRVLNENEGVEHV